MGRAVAEVVPHFWPALKPLYERALAGETIANQEISGRCGDVPVQVIHRRVSCYPIFLGPSGSSVIRRKKRWASMSR